MVKKIAAIGIILIISAIFNTAGALEKTRENCNLFNSKAAAGEVLVSIPYGEKENDISRIPPAETKNAPQKFAAYLTVDGSGNIYVIDEAKQKILKFNAADKKVSKISDYEKSAAKKNGYPDEGAAERGTVYEGKRFIVLMESDELSVVNAADTKEIALKYPVRSKDETMRVSDAKLVGIDASGNFYLHVTVVKNNKTIAENDIIKFKKGGLLSKKTRVPYYILDDGSTEFTGIYTLLKEDAVVSHNAGDKSAFNIVSYEIK